MQSHARAGATVGHESHLGCRRRRMAAGRSSRTRGAGAGTFVQLRRSSGRDHLEPKMAGETGSENGDGLDRPRRRDSVIDRLDDAVRRGAAETPAGAADEWVVAKAPDGGVLLQPQDPKVRVGRARRVAAAEGARRERSDADERRCELRRENLYGNPAQVISKSGALTHSSRRWETTRGGCSCVPSTRTRSFAECRPSSATGCSAGCRAEPTRLYVLKQRHKRRVLLRRRSRRVRRTG